MSVFDPKASPLPTSNHDHPIVPPSSNHQEDNASLERKYAPALFNLSARVDPNLDYCRNVHARPAYQFITWNARFVARQQKSKMNLVGQTVEVQRNQIEALYTVIKLLSQQNANLINSVIRIENTLRANPYQQQHQQQQHQKQLSNPPPSKQ